MCVCVCVCVCVCSTGRDGGDMAVLLNYSSVCSPALPQEYIAALVNMTDTVQKLLVSSTRVCVMVCVLLVFTEVFLSFVRSVSPSKTSL